jgi:tungstate transport system substrate-binding protein
MRRIIPSLPRIVALISTLSILSFGLTIPVLAAYKSLLLASTTSFQDSGLLDVLIPLFEKESGYIVKTITVGSGQAIKMGQRGEVDLLLVHSPETEKKFMAMGAGSSSRLVMHNDFILVGPAADPAKVLGSKIASDALKKVADGKALFISRNDNSGTHAKENELWKAAGVDPGNQKWYMKTGLGMGLTLFIADEREGYTLTDRGTYLALKKKLNLVIILEGDPKLLNVYHVIEVNAARWPKVNSAGAKAFVKFMVSPRTQKLIGSFGVDKFGAQLFIPDADKKSEDLGL